MLGLERRGVDQLDGCAAGQPLHDRVECREQPLAALGRCARPVAPLARIAAEVEEQRLRQRDGRYLPDDDLLVSVTQAPHEVVVQVELREQERIARGRSAARLVSEQRCEALPVQRLEPAGGFVALPLGKSDSGPHVRPSSGEKLVECATITRDARGDWWIAYDYDDAIWIRRSQDPAAAMWEAPVEIARGIDDDDLCAIVETPDSVGVAWTDQIHDGVFFRTRANGKPPDEWGPTETILPSAGRVNNGVDPCRAQWTVSTQPISV